MKGSNEIFTDLENVARLPHTMFVYMICVDINTCNDSGWTKIRHTSTSNYHRYVNVNESLLPNPQEIFLRITPAGIYTLSNLGAAYLFNDDFTGKF